MSSPQPPYPPHQGPEPPTGALPYGYGFPPPGYLGPPSGYGYPPPGAPGQPFGYARPPARNGLAITSLVLGILAVITCWLTLPGIILGILAAIFGGVGIARARSDRVSNKGMAIAGLVTGILGAAVGTVLFVVALQIAADCQERFGSTITEEQLQRCVQDSIGG